MLEDKKCLKESRPMSAKNPLQTHKHHLKKNECYLSEKEFNILAQKQKIPKVYNLLYSPLKNEMKDYLFLENTSKNLFNEIKSEIKENRTKTRLPKIPSSTTTLSKFQNQRKIIKLGIIDAHNSKFKLKNKISKEDNESSDIILNDNSAHSNIHMGYNKNKLEIDCHKKEIQNINNKNKISIKKRNIDNDNNDSNNKENQLLILTEHNKEKGKLNEIVFRKNSFSKNIKSIDKISNTIYINKKKEKEIYIENKEKQHINNNSNKNNKEFPEKIKNKMINNENKEIKKDNENNNNNENIEKKKRKKK